MRHLLPWPTATQRRRALAEAEAREAAEYDRAVQRIIEDVAAVDKRGGPTAATRRDEP